MSINALICLAGESIINSRIIYIPTHELMKTIKVSRGIGFSPSLTSLRTNRNSINLQMAKIHAITNACVNKVCIVLNTIIYLFIQLRIYTFEDLKPHLSVKL